MATSTSAARGYIKYVMASARRDAKRRRPSITCVMSLAPGLRSIVRGRYPVAWLAGAHPMKAKTTTEETMASTRGTVLSAAASALLIAVSAHAQTNGPGVTDKEIKIGQTMPYSGPVSAWSVQGRVDQAYMTRLNAKGGINGRSVKLLSLDDGFSPPKAVERVRELVESEQVLGLFGSVGTVPNVAVAKYLNQKKVPHLVISSAAGVFASPNPYRWSTAFYMLQPTEATLLARYIMSSKPNAKIGILYQNDEYGKGYLKAFRDALGDKAKEMIVKESSYDVSDPTIDSQIIELKSSGADTLFNVSTAKFGAQAIRKVHELNWKPTHVIVQAISSIDNVLRPAGLEQSKDLISLQFVKFPGDPEWNDDPAMKEYYAFMKEYAPGEAATDSTAAFAYMTSHLIELILRNSGNNLTRENVLKQATNIKDLELPLLLPGIKVNYTPTDYSPIQQARVSRFDGTKWVRFGELISARDKAP
jgi:branched-chain amino acid transport system substrate-binding protein